MTIATAFPERTPVEIDPGRKPALSVVIDTEEEFDWSKGFFREKTSVRHLERVATVQKVFDEFGIRPTYVVDYPVATQPEGSQPLKEILDDGRAEIGAHLHPWVNPPFEEEVSSRNSFPGNLGRDLEARKLAALGDAIEEAFGARPKVYRAGRYGIGPETGEILEEQGFEVDLSVCPRMDYRPQGGPDYTAWSPQPFWFGRKRRLLEIPRSAGYTGLLRSRANLLRPFIKNAYVRGVLSRTGMFTWSVLSPEAVPLHELKRFTRWLHGRGWRLFVFDFHSPSIEPGHTPYIETEADRRQFLDHCRRYFEFFLSEMTGEATTPLTLKRELDTVDTVSEKKITDSSYR
ncbi:MAG: polysaccharide deacetylase family protein [Planctomycetota bacterium]|jgi:hypothetical protein